MCLGWNSRQDLQQEADEILATDFVFKDIVSTTVVSGDK